MGLTKLQEAEILRYMGMPKNQADEELLKQIHQGYKQLEVYADPKVIYRCFNLNINEGYIGLEGTRLNFYSKDLEKLFEKCESCYLLGATLGTRVDSYINRLQKEDMLEALIFNALAATKIESICDNAEKEIAKEISHGQYLTMCYSPGYGDVSIEIQRDILDVLDATKRIGLTTTKASMLIPTKSVTAFIGIANEKVERQRTCNTCTLKENCDYRKRGEQCGNT